LYVPALSPILCFIILISCLTFTLLPSSCVIILTNL
jgi:hypothetical protein